MSHDGRVARRIWLRGTAGALIAVPLLEGLRFAAGRSTVARAAPALKGRFVGMFTTGSTVPARHYPLLPGQAPVPAGHVPVPYYVSGLPAVDTTEFRLGETLDALEPHRKDLLILEGIDPRGYGGHNLGQAIVGRDWKGARQSPGISLDQEIARHSATKFRSLEVGVQNRNQGDRLGQISWLGSGLPAKAENNPAEVWKRVFAGLSPKSDPAAMAAYERAQAARKSMLDDTLEQVTVIEKQIGGADARKLRNYLDALREIEKRIAATPLQPNARCVAPGAPTALDFVGSAEAIPTIAKLQIDMIVAALACDLASVATLPFGQGGSDMRHPWIGVNDPLHYGLGHAPSEDIDKQNKIVKVNNWYASQFAYLIDRLKAFGVMKETLCLWMVELSRGNKHSAFNAPIVMAGSPNGYFRTGRYVRFERKDASPFRFKGRSETELFVEILRALGVEAAAFGDAGFYGQPMDNLRAA